MADDQSPLGPEDQGDPENEPALTMTPDDLLPILNIAENAKLAALRVGMTYNEAVAVMLATYDVLLKGAIGA